MSSRTASASARAKPTTRAPGSSGRPRSTAAARRRQAARTRRRRLITGILVAVVGLCGIVVVSGAFDTAVKSITLPLRHEDIIRQQAADKGLDPTLIAGVIYTESHFRDAQTSPAGAEGLMQLTPATARYIAGKSGGIAFRVEDLATPQVNIAYGAYYLRYLLNRYGDNQTLALAAYNGGEGNVDRWRAAAAARGLPFTTARIPFAETRDYVGRVRTAMRSYRSEYAHELGV